MEDNYDDIIGLEHHVSATRPRMTMEERAAQFAPFAALTGFEEAIDNVAHTTVQQDEECENE